MEKISTVFIFLIIACFAISLVAIQFRKFSEPSLYPIIFPQPNDLRKANSTAVESLALDTWIILSFCDWKYVPSAKLWYDRLSNLGYSNHVIGTLDRQAFTKLNSSYRVLHASDKVTKLSEIWRIRMQTTIELLKKGTNVFLSDVDSIWIKRLPFQNIDSKYDAIHSYGTVFPKNIYEKWGFVLCGCIAGYRANNKTIKLFETLLSKCRITQCDDQRILNNVYADNYDMHWNIPEGYSQRHNFTVYVFPGHVVQRGTILSCSASITSPLATKTNQAKISIWNSYKRKCVSSLD